MPLTRAAPLLGGNRAAAQLHHTLIRLVTGGVVQVAGHYHVAADRGGYAGGMGSSLQRTVLHVAAFAQPKQGRTALLAVMAFCNRILRRVQAHIVARRQTAALCCADAGTACLQIMPGLQVYGVASQAAAQCAGGVNGILPCHAAAAQQVPAADVGGLVQVAAGRACSKVHIVPGAGHQCPLRLHIRCAGIQVLPGHQLQVPSALHLGAHFATAAPVQVVAGVHAYVLLTGYAHRVQIQRVARLDAGAAACCGIVDASGSQVDIMPGAGLQHAAGRVGRVCAGAGDIQASHTVHGGIAEAVAGAAARAAAGGSDHVQVTPGRSHQAAAGIDRTADDADVLPRIQVHGIAGNAPAQVVDTVGRDADHLAPSDRAAVAHVARAVHVDAVATDQGTAGRQIPRPAQHIHLRHQYLLRAAVRQADRLLDQPHDVVGSEKFIIQASSVLKAG